MATTLESAVALALLLAASCGGREESASPAPAASSSVTVDSGEVVAQVGNQVITRSDLEQQIRRMPAAARASYAQPAPRKRLVERLVRTKLLALEARKRGLDKSPEVVRLLEQALVNQLMKIEVDDRLKAGEGVPAKVDEYLKQHPDELARPDEVRVGLILVRDAGKAQQVAAQARAAKNAAAFAELVRRHSEDPSSRTRGGELPFFSRDTDQHPRPLVDAAFTLQQPGQVTGPVKIDKGYAILRLIEKRTGSRRPLREVRARVEAKVRERLRAQRVAELVQRLRAEHSVKIHEENLAPRR
jgi:peptidyl-prolyl cis-trans isomerase C